MICRVSIEPRLHPLYRLQHRPWPWLQLRASQISLLASQQLCLTSRPSSGVAVLGVIPLGTLTHHLLLTIRCRPLGVVLRTTTGTTTPELVRPIGVVTGVVRHSS